MYNEQFLHMRKTFGSQKFIYLIHFLFIVDLQLMK